MNFKMFSPPHRMTSAAPASRINTGDARPILQTPCRLPLEKQENAKVEVDTTLKQGVTEPSTSAWSSTIVKVKKNYPLPRIDSTLEALSSSSWFCTLDLKSGYWQVKMDKVDREKTASFVFVLDSGSFGLCRLATATHQRPLRDSWNRCFLVCHEGLALCTWTTSWLTADHSLTTCAAYEWC